MAENYSIKSSTLTDIANAIREKNGQQTQYKPAEMAEAIKGISGGSGNDVLNSIIDRSITEFSSDIKTVGDYAFANCKKLKSVDIKNATTVGKKAFLGCELLSSISMPNVENLDVGSISYIINLKEIVLRSAKSLPQECFNADIALTNVEAPEVLKINSNCFNRCTSLNLVNIPKATCITGNAFQNCKSLQLIDLPKVTTLEWIPFIGCSSLVTVILRSPTVCTINTSTTFKNTPIESGTGYIYVPKSLVEQYKQATNWTVYAEQIRAIEDYPEITGGAV